MSYRFTLEAKDDLHAAVDFYESQHVGLGAEFAVDVGIGIARVMDAPMRWPEVEPGIRKYRIDRFPYGIFYQLQGARDVEIVAVFDLRARPDSWRRGVY